MAATATLPVELLQSDLKELIARLHVGETVTLTASDGAPLAVLISLKAKPKPLSQSEWLAKWQTLSKEIDRHWKSDKSAVEILSEMRR